jgi:hypothetical protein
MAKLRLSINSNGCLGVYGIVDIIFNGTTLVSSKQLSATIESLEYDIAGIDNTSNTLKISVLNDQAHDANNNGDFNDAEDQVLKAQVSNLSYSSDNVNFTSLLPQAATSYTVPGGLYAGNVLTVTESVTEFVSWDATGELLFNSDGIINSTQISGVKFKIFENGTVQDIVNGITRNSDGNEVGAP